MRVRSRPAPLLISFLFSSLLPAIRVIKGDIGIRKKRFKGLVQNILVYLSCSIALDGTIVNREMQYCKIYGLKSFSFSSLIGLKCLALLETSVILFSTAVAAIIASPALRPEDKVYSSTYIEAL